MSVVIISTLLSMVRLPIGPVQLFIFAMSKETCACFWSFSWNRNLRNYLLPSVLFFNDINVTEVVEDLDT